MEVKPGYKHTEVGVIPDDWEVMTLSGVCRSICDGTHFTPRYVRYGVPFYSVENVTTNDFVDTKYISEAEHTQLIKRCKPERGDILMSRITAGVLGDTRILDWDVNASIYVSLALLKPNGVIVPEYLYRYSRSASFLRAVERKGLVNATPKKINMRDIGAILLPVPKSHTEQRAIAAALSDVDALLDGLERLIAKKRDLKQATVQQLLTGRTRLPGFHGEWQSLQVQDVIDSSFCGPSPTCEERNVQDDAEWGVLKTTAATKEHGWDWTKHKTLPRVFWNQPHLELTKGDVIITKAGPRHRVGVAVWVDSVPPHIIVSGKMIGLRPHPDKVMALMLAAAISAREAQNFLDQRTTGMAESQVNFENAALLATPIRIPRIDEQKAIATVISDMDAELSALRARRDKTGDLKQAMMQELLTGKTRLVSAGALSA